MELQQIAASLTMWARRKPLVKRVFIFGSRIRDNHRPDSDIDIAIELDPTVFQGSDESGGLATWMFEAKGWKEEIQEFIPFEVQLERFQENQTPTVGRGLAESSQLVYEKAI